MLVCKTMYFHIHPADCTSWVGYTSLVERLFIETTTKDQKCYHRIDSSQIEERRRNDVILRYAPKTMVLKHFKVTTSNKSFTTRYPTVYEKQPSGKTIYICHSIPPNQEKSKDKAHFYKCSNRDDESY